MLEPEFVWSLSYDLALWKLKEWGTRPLVLRYMSQVRQDEFARSLHTELVLPDVPLLDKPFAE